MRFILHGPKGCLAKRGPWPIPIESEKQWGAWLRADEQGRKTEPWQGSKGPAGWSSPMEYGQESDGEK